MPHRVTEFAQQLASAEPIPKRLEAVHRAVPSCGLFEEPHIRTRAVPVVHYRTGAGRAPFVHARLRIHRSRNETRKRPLSTAVLNAIRALQWPVSSRTVEGVDMAVDTHAKHLAP